MSVTTAGEPRSRRRRRLSSRGDRATLGLFVGLPTFFHVLLVWLPAIATILLSFTFWTGINFSDITWAGVDNYDNINNYDDTVGTHNNHNDRDLACGSCRSVGGVCTGSDPQSVSKAFGK